MLVLLACSVDFKFACYHRECATDLALATTKVGSFFGLSSLTLWWARFAICSYATSVNGQVREIVSILDIDVLIYPTPRNGPNFRPKAVELGGKRQFPYMVRAHN